MRGKEKWISQFVGVNTARSVQLFVIICNVCDVLCLTSIPVSKDSVMVACAKHGGVVVNLVSSKLTSSDYITKNAKKKHP